MYATAEYGTAEYASKITFSVGGTVNVGTVSVLSSVPSETVRQGAGYDAPVLSLNATAIDESVAARQPETTTLSAQAISTDAIAEQIDTTSDVTLTQPTQELSSDQPDETVSGDALVAIGQAADWYDSNWNARKKITIKASEVDSGLNDFPVFVDLSGISGISNAGAVRVTEADGTTEVARDIVNSGKMFFKAPTLSSSSDTEFYVYYDNSNASDYADTDTYGTHNVWTNGYTGVWLGHEGSGDTLYDRSGNERDGVDDTGSISWINTPYGTAVNVGGASIAMDGQQGLSGDQPFTTSMWMRSYGSGGSAVMSVNYAKAHRGIDWWISGGGTLAQHIIHEWSHDAMKAGGDENATDFIDKYDDSWHRVVSTYDGTKDVSGMNMYADGLHQGQNVQKNTLSSDDISQPVPTRINGRNDDVGSPDPSNYLTYLKVFDFRVANKERSQAWISADYENRETPSTFYSVGPEESPQKTEKTIETNAISPDVNTDTTLSVVSQSINTQPIGTSVETAIASSVTVTAPNLSTEPVSPETYYDVNLTQSSTTVAVSAVPESISTSDTALINVSTQAVFSDPIAETVSANAVLAVSTASLQSRAIGLSVYYGVTVLEGGKDLTASPVPEDVKIAKTVPTQATELSTQALGVSITARETVTVNPSAISMAASVPAPVTSTEAVLAMSTKTISTTPVGESVTAQEFVTIMASTQELITDTPSADVDYGVTVSASTPVISAVPVTAIARGGVGVDVSVTSVTTSVPVESVFISSIMDVQPAKVTTGLPFAYIFADFWDDKDKEYAGSIYNQKDNQYDDQGFWSSLDPEYDDKQTWKQKDKPYP